jgi:hypothetical protein
MFAPKYLINEETSWEELSGNENGCHLLKYRFNEIDWSYLSLNESDEALYILRCNKDKIIWNCLNSNENNDAIKLLQENPEKINWYYVSMNQSKFITELLRENIDKINWTFLSENPSAIDLIQENIKKIYWPRFCLNNNAYNIIKSNLNKVCWNILGSNTSPELIDILDNYIIISKSNETMEQYTDWYTLSKNPMSSNILNKNIDKIDWDALCCNKNDNCLKILEKHQYKIKRWDLLCENSSPRAIKILENNIDKIDWNLLSYNKCAIKILEQNIDKINWKNISSNYNAIHLFAPLDHMYMKEQIQEFKNELVSYVLSPERLNSIHLLYYSDISFIEMLNKVSMIYCE